MQKESIKKYRVNKEITNVNFVKLVMEDGNVKEMSFYDAIQIAKNTNLDLVEVANDGKNIPIIKLMNYEKFLYKQKKINKKNKLNKIKTKEIQLSPNISLNDLLTKFNNAKRFIEDGDRVKVILKLKGRENTLKELYQKKLYEFIDMMNDISIPESLPKEENNNFIIFFKPKNNK
jgi:translation initiation factor IF-3